MSVKKPRILVYVKRNTKDDPDHDAEFCVKESRNLIGLGNFGAAGFSITAGLRWYSPFLHFPHESLTPAIIT